ncbi:flavodoxin [uncultured Methanosphaera sp.]|uniref:flavodoxin family protein n=1 Tax=uncultured Methanosphaera sp. TaxID=262501 RepID=UPI002592B843|nr:flavodoxin [uncultured Methanosphaera sp.]
MSVLVTYSSNNKIKIVSEFIANRIDADSIEIKDLKRKNGFFNNIRNNYNAICLNQTEISPEVIDFTNYNLILLGTPSTCGNPSPAILTLIDNCNFKNKDVIIYTTTNSKQGTGVLNELKKRVEIRGGRIINSFIVRVNDKSNDELIRNTLKVLYELDLEIYI